MRIMARRMMSAAEPWIGALMEARSTKLRSAGCAELALGKAILRPKMVVDVAVGLHLAALLGHVVLDAGEAREIGLDVLARLAALDAELVGEPEGRDAVDDAEIDRLGAAPHVGRHALDRHAEHLARRHGVDVEALLERILQRLDVGDVGEDAQLDLAVVGRDQDLAGRARRTPF